MLSRSAQAPLLDMLHCLTAYCWKDVDSSAPLMRAALYRLQTVKENRDVQGVVQNV